MIRARSFVGQGGGVSPGRVVAEVPGQAPLISGICSSDVYDIESITDNGSNVILVTTRNTTPFVTGDSVYCRVGGFDGRTTLGHRANNWTGGPLVNPTTLKPDPSGIQLGGDPWTVTVIDSQNFTLNGSVWKVDAADPEPVFLYGTAYKTLVDAWPAIDAAMTYIGTGPGTLTFGIGFFAMLADAAHLAWRPRGNITIQGQGPLQTTLFRGDYYNQTPWQFGYSNSTVRNICQDGNSNFNAAGRHGWIFDSLTEDTTIQRAIMENVWTRGIPGYGVADGTRSSKYYYHFNNCEWLNVNNSAIDLKGQNLSSPHGEFFGAGKCDRNTAGFWSMGTMGSNKLVPVAMVNNPVITNTANAHTIQVRLPVFASAGQRVNLNGLTTTGGIVFGDNWFPVTFGSTLATIDVSPQTVTSTVAAGGGSAGMAWMPAFRNKGSAMEVRGGGWNITNFSCRGWMGRHNGISFLGGDGSNVNGFGGHYSVLSGYTSIDTTPSGLGYNSAVHLNLGAAGTVVSSVVLVGNGSGTGVLSGGNTTLNTINARVSSMALGVAINADKSLFKIQMDSCTAGATVDGGMNFTNQELPDNPFTIVSGSQDVNVHAPLFTGISVGDTITIGGAEPDSSGAIDMNGPRVVTAIVDVNNFTVQILLPAPESESFGGTEAFIQISDTIHHVSGVTAELDMRTMGTGTGLAITSDVTDVAIINSHYDGNGAAYTQVGTGIVTWGPGNTGLPNTQQRITLPDTGTATALTYADGGKKVFLPSTASGVVVVPLPVGTTVPADWFVDVAAQPGTGAIGIQLTAQTGEKINDGATASSSGGTFTSSTEYAACRISRAGTGFGAWIVTEKSGTWTAA